ncbi:hypothetical protein QOT17_000894 [Balamuthia mandrillaris]
MEGTNTLCRNPTVVAVFKKFGGHINHTKASPFHLLIVAPQMWVHLFCEDGVAIVNIHTGLRLLMKKKSNPKQNKPADKKKEVYWTNEHVSRHNNPSFSKAVGGVNGMDAVAANNFINTHPRSATQLRVSDCYTSTTQGGTSTSWNWRSILAGMTKPRSSKLPSNKLSHPPLQLCRSFVRRVAPFNDHCYTYYHHNHL